MAFSVRNEPGTLVRALGVIADHGINMTKLESRPSSAGTWEYVFWVDVDSDVCDSRGPGAAFLADLRRFVPALSGNHLVFGPSGVRAQALDADGSLVDDFQLGGSERVLHVFNAPSPAATSSLAIGRVLAGEAVERFGL